MYGLMMAGVPSLNTWSSIYCCAEKAVIQAELFRIRAGLGLDPDTGEDQFPVISLQYFASYREMMYTQSFPAVVKIGSAHAGMGKMQVNDHHQFEDFRTVLAMTNNEYCTAEPFILADYDLRIQKIGNNYRVFRRTQMGHGRRTLVRVGLNRLS